MQYFLSPGDRTWKIDSLLSLQEGTSTVAMDGKTLTLSAGDSLLVPAQSTWVEINNGSVHEPPVPAAQVLCVQPTPCWAPPVQKHSICEGRICNSLCYFSGQKCFQEEKPDIHSSSPLMIKDEENKFKKKKNLKKRKTKKKHYQENAACKDLV